MYFYSLTMDKHRNIHMRIFKIVSYTIVEENVNLYSTGRALQYTFLEVIFLIWLKLSARVNKQPPQPSLTFTVPNKDRPEIRSQNQKESLQIKNKNIQM